MKRCQKWILATGVAVLLIFSVPCRGQIVFNAPAPKAAPAQTITGTVFAPSGARAPGVVLRLLPPVRGASEPIKSGSDGAYTLSPKAGILRAASNAPDGRGYSLIARDLEHNFVAAQIVDETTTNVDLHLQPGLTLSFKLQDPEGKPITNATGRLLIYFGIYGASINEPLYGLADEQGKVQFTALPRGYPYKAVFRSPDHGSINSPIINENETQTTNPIPPVVLMKVANLKLSGRVVGPNGKPVAGVRITAIGVEQPATNTLSDDSGHFSLNICEGDVVVDARIQGATGSARATGGDTNVEVKLKAIAPVQVQPAPQIRPKDPLPFSLMTSPPAAVPTMADVFSWV